MENEDNRPLVAFTTLEPLAVGGLAGLLLVRGPALVPGIDWGGLAVLAAALLALAASFLHLGHPFRAYRAIARFSSSWLSREVLFFGLFVLLLAAYSMPWSGGEYAHQVYGTFAVGLGFLALFATGKVYRLRARPAWNHWSTVASFPLGALSAGLAFGIFAAELALPVGGNSRAGMSTGVTVATAFLGLALIASWVRLRRLRSGTLEEQLAWQMVVGPYRWALVVRYLAVAIAATMLVTSGMTIALAWIVAALGEMGDRVLLFYATVPVSPVDRVEALRGAQAASDEGSDPCPASGM